MTGQHPDFIITVDGQNVTGDCISWTLNDVEDGMGTLTVNLDNTDKRYDGKLKSKGGEVSLRFGTSMSMNEQVTLSVKKYTEHYGVDGLTITVVGADCTEKLSDKTGRGNTKSGKKALEKLEKEAKVKISKDKLKDDGKEDENECGRSTALGGIKGEQFLQQNIDQMEPGKSGGGDDSGGGGGGDGDTFQKRESAPGVNPKGNNDKNRMKNANQRAKGQEVTAKIQLRGCPIFKSKRCVTILNVGSEGSGKWYIKNATHSWSSKGGYTTQAQLLKGDGPQPNVFYADMYKKDTIYAGPRKTGDKPEDTFFFGDGGYITKFEWTQDTQSNRGSSQNAGGKTVDPKKPKKPVIKIDSKEK